MNLEVDIHSNIDHELVNSSMLNKNIKGLFLFLFLLIILLCYLVINLLIVYCKKITTDESFLLPKKKKKNIRKREIFFLKKKKKKNLWDRYKCLELMKEICHHNTLEILSEEIENEELSIDCVIEKFINTTNSIAKDLSIITSSTEIRKVIF